jgi:putative ABC transport system substrate-binding protein
VLTTATYLTSMVESPDDPGMDRRRFLLTSLAGALAGPLAAAAQQTGKVYRVGYMGTSSPSLESNLVEAFRRGLRELGYIEGQNIVVEYRWAEGQYDRFRQLAAELVSLRVDVIVTAGTPGALAAKQATTTIPVVMLQAYRFFFRNFKGKRWNSSSRSSRSLPGWRS